jgi:NADPH:quinone reductase-like Zn-dependent oxidoreductase
LGNNRSDVVVDVGGGPQWPQVLDTLKPRGRYALSGAIARPIVQMDLRNVYLKDLTRHGCTSQDANVFPDLVSYIEGHEIKPLAAKQFPLRDIVLGHEEFLSKKHVGKIILNPQV